MPPAPQAPPAAVDVQLVLPFVKAVRQLFATMVRTDVTIGRPYAKTNDACAYDVSGVIAFTGELVGAMSISLSRPAATRLVEAFVGTAPHPESADFADAIGELANMIAGQAKCQLAMRAAIGLPCVVIGQGHSIKPTADVPCVVIPCQTTGGAFAVEVGVRRATPVAE